MTSFFFRTGEQTSTWLHDRAELVRFPPISRDTPDKLKKQFLMLKLWSISQIPRGLKKKNPRKHSVTYFPPNLSQSKRLARNECRIDSDVISNNTPWYPREREREATIIIGTKENKPGRGEK